MPVGEALYLKGYYNSRNGDCCFHNVGEALYLKGYYNYNTPHKSSDTVGEALDLKGYYNYKFHFHRAVLGWRSP